MKRGFPRPRTYVGKTSRHPSRGSYGKRWNSKTYPHPYTASDDAVSNISEGRVRECTTFKRCGTCGEPVDDDLVGLIIYNTHSPKIKSKDWLHAESGPYHFKCLVLNFTMCPHLVETKQFLPAVGLWKDVREEIINKANGR